MLSAEALQADLITPEVLRQGLGYADQRLRGQTGLTPEDHFVLDLVLERGSISDADVSLDDLQRLKAKEFSQLLPILENLVQKDLLRRLPTDRAAQYEATPLLIGSHPELNQLDDK